MHPYTLYCPCTECLRHVTRERIPTVTSTKLDLETAQFNREGWFISEVTKEGVFLRTPDSLMLPMNQDARLEVNAARAAWMAETLNAALLSARSVVL